jgi:hypothetical protein
MPEVVELMNTMTKEERAEADEDEHAIERTYNFFEGLTPKARQIVCSVIKAEVVEKLNH